MSLVSRAMIAVSSLHLLVVVATALGMVLVFGASARAIPGSVDPTARWYPRCALGIAAAMASARRASLPKGLSRFRASARSGTSARIVLVSLVVALAIALGTERATMAVANVTWVLRVPIARALYNRARGIARGMVSALMVPVSVVLDTQARAART